MKNKVQPTIELAPLPKNTANFQGLMDSDEEKNLLEQ